MKKIKGKIEIAGKASQYLWSINVRGMSFYVAAYCWCLHRKSAHRAARNAAKRLNIEIVEDGGNV